MRFIGNLSNSTSYMVEKTSQGKQKIVLKKLESWKFIIQYSHNKKKDRKTFADYLFDYSECVIEDRQNSFAIFRHFLACRSCKCG